MRILDRFMLPRDFRHDDPDLVAAKFNVLARQVPMLYAVICSAAVALAVSFYGAVPLWQIAIPLTLLVCVGLIRSWFWILAARRPYSHDFAIKTLLAINPVSMGLGLLMVATVLWLFPHANSYQRSHLVLHMMICANACIFFLMPVRRGAYWSAIFLLLPIAYIIYQDPNSSLIAMQVSVVVTLVIVMFALSKQDDELGDLIRTRRALKLKQQQTELLAVDNQKLAMEDPLTQIPNRRQFLLDLEEIRQKAEREAVPMALALINVDNFKSINTVYGYSNGDLLLCAIARRLQDSVGSNCRVARISGDEFGVLYAGDKSRDWLFQEAQSLCQTLAQPFVLPDFTLYLGTSAGLAVLDGDQGCEDDAMEQAGYALHLAKRSNRGGALLFTEALRSDFRYRSQLEQALKSGIWRDEIHVLFQPVVSISSSQIEGFEALARWNSAQFGSVPPDVFISIAERCGLIGELTDRLLAIAASTAVTWPQSHRLLFNLSARDICRPGLADRVASILRDAGLDAARLEVEVTETSLMQDFAQARATISELKAMGIRIALDDFGTGFSNLAHLQHLAPDVIKIDRSFIIDIETSATNRNIVKSIISLAQNLGCQWVVEGLETAGQVRLLGSMGTDLMQGFFFSKPLDAGLAGQLVINGLPPSLLETLQ